VAPSLFLITRTLIPLGAVLFLLPFFIPPELLPVVLGRLVALWAALGIALIVRYFAVRVLTGGSRLSSEPPFPSPAARATSFADIFALGLSGFFLLGTLEVYRARTSSLALLVLLLALLALGARIALRLRSPDPISTLSGRLLALVVAITALSVSASYAVSDEWRWEPTVFFLGVAIVLGAGQLGRELPELAASPTLTETGRKRLVTMLHLGFAAGPTVILGLTATHTLPRLYLLLLFLIYFLNRTYHALVPFQTSGQLHPNIPRELQAGAVLFIVLLGLFRVVAFP
jgi:hypothetical protein